MDHENGEKPALILAHQLHQLLIGSQKEDRCVLTVHFILSEHVNAFPRTNVHKEHGSLFSGEVTEVNPIDLRNSKKQNKKNKH